MKPKLLGKFVLINIPEKPEYKIEVDHNTKEELEKQWLKKLNKLEVWAVGDAANPSIKEGDFVLVSPDGVNQMKMVPFEKNGETINRALILDYHIVLVWP